MASIKPKDEGKEETTGDSSLPTLLSRRRTSTGLHSSLRPPSRISKCNNHNEISDEVSSGSIWKTNNNPTTPAHYHTVDGTEKSCSTTSKSSGTSSVLLPPEDIILLTQTTATMIQHQHKNQTREPQVGKTENGEEKQDEKAAYRIQQPQRELSISLLSNQTDSSVRKTRNSAASEKEGKISILSADEILSLSQTTTTMMEQELLQHKKRRESHTTTTTTEEHNGDMQRTQNSSSNASKEERKMQMVNKKDLNSISHEQATEDARVRISQRNTRVVANHPSSATTTTTATSMSCASAPGVVRVRGISYAGQGCSQDIFQSDSFSVEPEKDICADGMALQSTSTSSTRGTMRVGVEEAPHSQRQIHPGATQVRGPGEGKKIPSLVVAAEVMDEDDDIEKKLDERLKQERSTLRMEMMKDAPRAEVIEKSRRRNFSRLAKVFWGVFVLLLFVGVVVGFILGVSRNDNDSENELEESNAPALVVEEEGGCGCGDFIARVPDTICYERIPGQGKSDVCTKEETLVKGGGGVPNLVAQSRLDQVFTADLSIMNGGEVAGDILEGKFTSDMLSTLFRFENSLITILLSGGQIIQVLEEAVEWTFVDNSTGCYPYAAGLRYNVDFDADFPHRLSQVEVKPNEEGVWMPIDVTHNYTVVTTSYLLSGGDGYHEFTRADQSTVRPVLTTPEGAFSNFGLRVKEFLDPPSSDYSTQSFITSPKCQVCHEFHTFENEP